METVKYFPMCALLKYQYVQYTFQRSQGITYMYPWRSGQGYNYTREKLQKTVRWQELRADKSWGKIVIEVIAEKIQNQVKLYG